MSSVKSVSCLLIPPALGTWIRPETTALSALGFMGLERHNLLTKTY